MPIKTQHKMRQQNERNVRESKSRQNSDLYEEANRTAALNSSIASSALRSKSSYLNSNKSKTQALLNKTPVTPTGALKLNNSGSFNAYSSSTKTRGELQ